MGMLGHAVEVMIAKREGDPLILDFWLDNEEYLELNKEDNIFADVSSMEDLLRRIPTGFVHPFQEEKDIREFLVEYDYMDQYADFEKQAKQIALSNIDSVVLMCVRDQEHGESRYELEWIKYLLTSNHVTTGTGGCKSSYDVESYLKGLINVQGTAMRKSVAKTAFFTDPEEEISFDSNAFLKEIQENEEQWMRAYGHAVEKHPTISFCGKAFVLSGMEALGDEYEIDIANAIAGKGGVVRKSVSGKTDYLIVDPRWAGESKVKEAIEQQKKGSSVKIILGTDFMAVI